MRPSIRLSFDRAFWNLSFFARQMAQSIDTWRLCRRANSTTEHSSCISRRNIRGGALDNRSLKGCHVMQVTNPFHMCLSASTTTFLVVRIHSRRSNCDSILPSWIMLFHSPQELRSIETISYMWTDGYGKQCAGPFVGQPDKVALKLGQRYPRYRRSKVFWKAKKLQATDTKTDAYRF